MKKRSMGLFIVMMLLVPFYSLYWYCSFQNQLKKETGLGFSGFGHMMATIFSFGIYFIVWNYKAGKRVAKLGGKDQSTLCLILAILGIGIVPPFILQNEVNNI